MAIVHPERDYAHGWVSVGSSGYKRNTVTRLKQQQIDKWSDEVVLTETGKM